MDGREEVWWSHCCLDPSTSHSPHFITDWFQPMISGPMVLFLQVKLKLVYFYTA